MDRGALVIGPAFADRIAEQTRGIGFFYYYRFPQDNRDAGVALHGRHLR